MQGEARLPQPATLASPSDEGGGRPGYPASQVFASTGPTFDKYSELAKEGKKYSELELGPYIVSPYEIEESE